MVYERLNILCSTTEQDADHTDDMASPLLLCHLSSSLTMRLLVVHAAARCPILADYAESLHPGSRRDCWSLMTSTMSPRSREYV
jgi:hypothetical protein